MSKDILQDNISKLKEFSETLSLKTKSILTLLKEVFWWGNRTEEE
jgi:hypothetical protein